MDSVNTRAATAVTGPTHPDRHRLEFEPAVVLPVQMQGTRMADASLVPEKLLLLGALPRNPVGKVLKRDLRTTVAAG